MKILLVSPYGTKQVGGAEQACARIAEKLSERPSTQVTWAADGSSLPASLGKVRLMPLSMGNGRVARALGGWILLLSPASVRSLRALRAAIPSYDVVHVHHPHYCTCVLALRWAKRAGVPAVLTNHNGPPSRAGKRGPFRAVRRMIERYAAGTATRVAYVSAPQKQSLDRKGDGRVVLCGYDENTFRTVAEKTARAERASLGWDDRPTLLYVGRFEGIKRMDVARGLAAARPEWRFVFVGDGANHPRSWNLPNVLAVPPSDPATIARYYRSADALILPTHSEGLPLVILEALACGLPIVTSGVVQLQHHVSAGSFVAVDDDAGDAEAVLRWSRALSDALRPDSLRALRADVLSHPTGLTWDRTADEYLSLYESIAKESR